MTKRKHPSIPFLTLFFLSVALFLSACSKKNGNGSSSTAYPFTATVNGSSFNANFVNPSIGGPGIAEIVNDNGLNIVIAVGIQIPSAKDTNLFVVVFPANITLNQPTDLNPNLNNGVAYSMEASPGSSTYIAYGTNPAYGGSGTLTVTELNQTTHEVAGTFSGTLGSSTGTTISVSNGKFHCILTSVSNPFPPNVKF